MKMRAANFIKYLSVKYNIIDYYLLRVKKAFVSVF